MKDGEKAYERMYGFIIGVLATGVVLGVMVLAVFFLTSLPRTDQATKYNMNCVTELSSDPLNDCKEK